MSYQYTANQIIKDSIKSAIFIDENALSFFTQESKELVTEEILSKELFENFKNEDISLSIHRFEEGDENKKELKKYLFEGRDLVLLDWKLANLSGEEYSLSMLADVVNCSHIHFCVIYTKEEGEELENIFKNILSYFSEKDAEYYIGLKELLELEEGIDEITDDMHFINLNRDQEDTGKIIGKLSRTHRDLVKNILELSGETNKKCAFIKASIALMNTHKSISPNPCPEVISRKNRILVINNTIISILNKTENSPSVFLANLSRQVISQSSSFTQLLGLEMQTILSKNSSFIDTNMLKISKDAFVHHWNHYKDEGQEHLFSEFVKDILLENVNLSLRGKKLILLDNDLLNSIDEKIPVTEEELISMNVFYNSHQLSAPKKLNFGDVFTSLDGNDCYICITALCDCLRSEEKIDNNFFFAKGTNIAKADALKLGDSAFISYLGGSKIVKWTEVNNQIGDKEQKFSPVYIKPIQFKVLNPALDKSGDIELGSINDKGESIFKKVKYVTTIKNSYSQRIANHAFSHPLRVGVDFAKQL